MSNKRQTLDHPAKTPVILDMAELELLKPLEKPVGPADIPPAAALALDASPLAFEPLLAPRNQPRRGHEAVENHLAIHTRETNNLGGVFPGLSAAALSRLAALEGDGQALAGSKEKLAAKHHLR